MSRELGDVVHDALESIGITEERVGEWLNKVGCGGCARRRRRLNQLSIWAKRIIAGHIEDTKAHIKKLKL